MRSPVPPPRLLLYVFFAVAGCDALDEEPPTEWDIVREMVTTEVTLSTAATALQPCAPATDAIEATGAISARFRFGGEGSITGQTLYADSVASDPNLLFNYSTSDPSQSVLVVNRNRLYWYFTASVRTYRFDGRTLTLDATLQALGTPADTIRLQGSYTTPTAVVLANVPTVLETCPQRADAGDFFVFRGTTLERWADKGSLRNPVWEVDRSWNVEKKGISWTLTPRTGQAKPGTYRFHDRGTQRVLDGDFQPSSRTADEVAAWARVRGIAPGSIVRLREKHRLVLERH